MFCSESKVESLCKLYLRFLSRTKGWKLFYFLKGFVPNERFKIFKVLYPYSIFRFCVCFKHKALVVLLAPLLKEIVRLHHPGCICLCGSCSSRSCLEFKATLPAFMKHSLCPATNSLHGSNVSFFNWTCVKLQCEQCWLHSENHVLNCPLSDWSSRTGTTFFLSRLIPTFPVNIIISVSIQIWSLGKAISLLISIPPIFLWRLREEKSFILPVRPKDLPLKCNLFHLPPQNVTTATGSFIWSVMSFFSITITISLQISCVFACILTVIHYLPPPPSWTCSARSV